MKVAPPQMLARIFHCSLEGSLLQLAHHPVANFVVQAYMAAIHTTPQVAASASIAVCRTAEAPLSAFDD